MKDRCVVCDIPTRYTKNDPLSRRRWYVEGSGQLCGKCWEKIYSDNLKLTKEKDER